MALTHFGLYVSSHGDVLFTLKGSAQIIIIQIRWRQTVFFSRRRVERNQPNLLPQYIDALHGCLKEKNKKAKCLHSSVPFNHPLNGHFKCFQYVGVVMSDIRSLSILVLLI